NRAVGIVKRVGIGRAGGRGVAAVAVVADGPGGDRREGVRRVVDVGVGERAARGRSPRRAIVDAAGLGDAAARGAGNDRGVVCAVDADGDLLLGAVDGGDREGVGRAVAGVERLNRAVGIVERV